MPHTKSGKIVNVGDTLTVLFTVRDVQLGEEFCNCTVETVEPMFPSLHKSALVINTKQAE